MRWTLTYFLLCVIYCDVVVVSKVKKSLRDSSDDDNISTSEDASVSSYDYSSDGSKENRTKKKSKSTKNDNEDSEESSSEDTSDDYSSEHIKSLRTKRNKKNIKYRQSENTGLELKRKIFRTTTTPIPPVEDKSPYGPFSSFIVNICKALISDNFSRKRVGIYFMILRSGLKGQGIDYVQKLRIRKFRKLLAKYSEYNKKRLKRKVHEFLVLIADGKPKKNAYLAAMNAIYTTRDDFKMDDYVYMLKNYGKKKLRPEKKAQAKLKKSTRKIIKNLIFHKFHDQEYEVKRDIENKFKSAMLEYWEGRINKTAIDTTLLKQLP